MRNLARLLPSICLAATLASCSPPTSDAIAALSISSMSYLEADDGFVVANGNDTKPIRAIARDADGRPLVDYTIAFFSDDPTVSFLQPPATNAQGVATGLIRSTTVGDKWVQALLANEQSVQAFGHGLRVAFVEDANAPPVHGVPSFSPALYLYSDSINAVANGNDVLTISVAGRLRPGQPIQLSSSNTNDVLVPSSGTLDAKGLFRATLRSTVAGSRTFRATAGSLQRSLTAALLPGAPDGNHCITVLSPNTAVADGMQAVTLFATIADHFNNAIAYETVEATSTSPNVQFGSNAGMTDASGVFSVDIRSTLASTPTIVAAVGGLTLSVQPTFVAGPASPFRSALTSDAQDLVLGQSSQIALRLQDTCGNPLSNDIISFQAGSSNDQFVPPTAATDNNGMAQTLFSAGVAGTRRVTARSQDQTWATDVRVHPSNPNARQSTFVALPEAAHADGVAASHATLTICDANQIPMPSVAVSFVALDANVLLSPASGTTDGNGVLSTSATSTTPTSTLLEASWSDATMAVDIRFALDPNR